MRKLLLAVVLISIAAIPACMPTQVPARLAGSQSNLVQIGKAMKMYASDWDDRLPPMRNTAVLKKAVRPYVEKMEDGSTEDLFVQPGPNKPYRVNAVLSNQKENQITSPAEIVALYEADPDQDGLRNALFMDGHVKHLDAREWLRVKKTSEIR